LWGYVPEEPVNGKGAMLEVKALQEKWS